MNSKAFKIGQRVMTCKMNDQMEFLYEGEIESWKESTGYYGIKVNASDWGTKTVYRRAELIRAVRAEAMK